MSTPQLTKPAAAVANVTKTDIERYEKLGAEACSLERQAKAKRAERKQVQEKIEAWVLANAPLSKDKTKPRTVNRSGYRLSIVTVSKSVSWVTEFTKAMGKAAADKLRKNVGKKEKLTVEKL